jgi:murein DD-endopeptidase MepM/ murein hydrolase activator NlpD
MIARRTLLTTGAAFALLPARAASGARTTFRGAMEQGGLVIGMAQSGAAVTVDSKSVQVSPDGLFAFGFPFDAAKPVEVEAVYRDGGRDLLKLEAAARTYDIQKIDGLPEEYVEPPPEAVERMKREHEAIWTARQADSAGTGFAEAFDWPFAGRLSGIFGSQRILNGKPMAPHLGVDIAAPEGTPIRAPADSIVAITDEYYLEGGFTLLDHGHGVNSCYLHQSQRLVKVGDAVKRGDVIGHVGMTGRATGPHCHWGLCWFQMKLDPSRATKTPEPPKA